MGTCFFKLPITLPIYKIQVALKIDSIHHVLPMEVLEFIKEDVKKNLSPHFLLKMKTVNLRSLSLLPLIHARII